MSTISRMNIQHFRSDEHINSKDRFKTELRPEYKRTLNHWKDGLICETTKRYGGKISQENMILEICEIIQRVEARNEIIFISDILHKLPKKGDEQKKRIWSIMQIQSYENPWKA